MKLLNYAKKILLECKKKSKLCKKPTSVCVCKKAPNNSTILRNCAPPVAALHVLKPFLLKSKPPNKDSEDDGHQKIPQTHLDRQGGQ